MCPVNCWVSCIRFRGRTCGLCCTLHELFIVRSDHDYDSWIADYDIPGVQGLELHQFCRATAWLREDVKQAADVMAPRCVQRLIKEKLFGSGHDLFAAAQQAISRAVEGPRIRKARAATSWRLWAVWTVGPAVYDAPRPTNVASRRQSGPAKLLGSSYRSGANLHTNRLLSTSGGLLDIGGASGTESARRSLAASDIGLASNACAFAWSVKRPSRSIGLDVGPEKQGGSLLRCHAGNAIVKSEARRRIWGAMRLGLEQLASSGEAEGSHVSSHE